jgi:hypothetical protein
MKRQTLGPALTAVLVFASLAAGSVAAQTAAENGPPPEAFGGNAGTTTVPAVAFAGMPSPDANGFSNFTYTFPGGGVSGLARLDLPNGVEITRLCVVGFDTTWHGLAQVTLVGWEYPAVSGGDPTPSRTVTTATTGYAELPGMGTFCFVPAPILVRSLSDLDGDGDAGWTAYGLRASLSYGPGGGAQDFSDGAVAFGAAVVYWRRTVAPAPAGATFPSDVPPSHAFFRFVEALAASGISGGCAPSAYCPDSPVTRGQMAVFLATALGLHWPN